MTISVVQYIQVMHMEGNKRRKESIRLQGFDYNSAGAYFITICTENRQQTLSRIVGGDVLDAPKVQLLPYGKIADKDICQLNDFYDTIRVDGYVIMPNHIHILLMVFKDGASRTSPPTKQHSAVSQFVSTFKRFCNKEYGINIWQRYYNDHVIRNQDDYDEHLRYIQENPIRWQEDELYTDG